jgi:2'-5' RNA ligase
MVDAHTGTRIGVCPQSVRSTIVSMQPSATPADSARLFIGLWPPDAVRDAALRHAGQWSWPRRARRVRPDKVHMTVHFLGAVPRERIAALTDALAEPFEPFELRLDHAELWPGGIAVLGADTVPSEAIALHARLRDAIERLGLTPERRPWRPHLTLARQAQGAVPPARHEAIAWPVRGFVLVESDPRPPTGYRVIASWP